MHTNTGELITVEELNKLTEEARKNYVPVKRDTTLQEEAQRQILLYSPCGCGSGKKFKFCCHKP